MIRVGVIGTSAWTERMYIGGLREHPDGRITAVCGRDLARTRDFAARNGITDSYTDYRDLLDSDIDAVIISTPNDTHYPMAMHALKNGLHVMCEKPLALTYAQADAMATEAARRGVVHCTAFTYNYFPHYKYIRRLLDEGYVGTPYHLNLRYYSTYGLDGAPVWRFDRRQSGEGALGDIGSHALALALDMLGEITAVSARLMTHVTRAAIPAAHRATDAGVLTVQFANGASGVIHVSMASFQPPAGGHKQALEISGSGGTLYYCNDFATTFTLEGAQVGADAAEPLRVPDDLWPANVSRANPRVMYGDLYTKANTMARDFVGAIAEGRPLAGLTFERGAAVQQLIDAAVQSHHENSRMVEV